MAGCSVWLPGCQCSRENLESRLPQIAWFPQPELTIDSVIIECSRYTADVPTQTIRVRACRQEFVHFYFGHSVAISPT